MGLGPKRMNRREFSRNMLGAAVGAAGSPALLSRFKETAADPEPPFQLSVMLWTVFRDLPFERRLEKVVEAGYRHVELVDEFRNWSDADFAAANQKKRQLHLTFDATAGVRLGAASPDNREAFLQEADAMLLTAEKLECSSLIVLSGNRIDGLAREAQHQACVENLKQAVDAAARRKITLLLENIDPEENPKYFLTSVAEGLQIVAEVNHPNVKFLYDFYHEQIAEGNLIEKLEKNIDRIGVVHIADVPGRHEPGTGEINYRNIFRKLAALNFKGYAAMEFLPTGDPVESLRAARKMAIESASA